MLNKTIIQGRIGKDIELRRTNNGIAVCAFSVACDRDYKDQDGSKATDWFKCVAWRQNAEYAAKYGTKGRTVCLEGRLQNRSYEDKNNNSHTVTEVMVDKLYFTDKGGDRLNEIADKFDEVEDTGDLPF